MTTSRAAGSARSRHHPVPDLAELAFRLTHRDRELCRLVWEHRVLTGPQCARLLFASPVTARHRLVVLAGLRGLDRFRPTWPLGQGSPPWHYVLGPAGAAVLAAEQGVTPARLGYRRDRALGVAHSPQLAHQVGVNGFFADLAQAARGRQDATLAEWWSARQCAARWGQVVRPDGYGRWRQGGREVAFFLEYDRGTEDQARLVGKLEGYRELAEATEVRIPVLVWLQSPVREANLHAAAAHLQVAAATATPALGAHPAARAWLPVGHRGPRRALASLEGL